MSQFTNYKLSLHDIAHLLYIGGYMDAYDEMLKYVTAIDELRAENDRLSEELGNMTELAGQLWKQRKASVEAMQQYRLFSPDSTSPVR